MDAREASVRTCFPRLWFLGKLLAQLKPHGCLTQIKRRTCFVAPKPPKITKYGKSRSKIGFLEIRKVGQKVGLKGCKKVGFCAEKKKPILGQKCNKTGEKSQKDKWYLFRAPTLPPPSVKNEQPHSTKTASSTLVETILSGTQSTVARVRLQPVLLS